MYALITGASSGIGREFALQLAKRGYNIIIVARREIRLEELKKFITKHYDVDVVIKEIDLSIKEECYRLYDECKDYKIKILINNAGFGKIGYFEDIPLEEELNMINTNISAVHILTKLFLKDMNKGKILNVASIAGLQPCPTMTTYGATKSYIINFSRGLNYELKRKKKEVHVSVLCPGPVNTEFDKVANTDFSLKYISAKKCARIGLDGLFKKKEIIIPSFSIKALSLAGKFTPVKLIQPIEYYIQTRKLKK
ncbi:MAG TPA: SDR family oxidoreductase [Clostridiales bacterium]|nr:SDR family oxidoreductase [Clostridiales bacterium]